MSANFFAIKINNETIIQYGIHGEEGGIRSTFPDKLFSQVMSRNSFWPSGLNFWLRHGLDP